MNKPFAVRILSALLAVLLILPACASAAETEARPTLLAMNADSFLEWFRKFDAGAEYDWVPWQWDIFLENGASLNGYLSDGNGEIGAYLGEVDSETEDAAGTLTGLLYVFPGTAEAFPEAAELIAAGESAELTASTMMLRLEENSFNLGAFALDPDTLSASTPTLPEMEALLRDAGFPVRLTRRYKIYSLGKGDVSTRVTVGGNSRVESLRCTYSGEDPAEGKEFLAAAAALLDGEAGEAAAALVRDFYDVLEVKKSRKGEAAGYSFKLARTKSYIYFNVDVPSSAEEAGAAVFPVDAPEVFPDEGEKAPADDGLVHTEETVIADEAGICFVALASAVRSQAWGAPYIQFTLENNTDEVLHIDLSGSINGYDVNRVVLQPPNNNMHLETIQPGEQLSGNMLFSSLFYEYMGADNASDLTVTACFRLDRLNSRKTDYELYYETGPVHIPVDGTYTASGRRAFAEDENIRLTAVDSFTENPFYYDDPSPCVLVQVENLSDTSVYLYFTDVEVNGTPVGEGELLFAGSYGFEAGCNTFATLRLQSWRTLGITEFRTISAGIKYYQELLDESGRTAGYEEHNTEPFTVSFPVE